MCGGDCSDCGDIVLVVVDGTAGWHWSVMVRDRGRYRAVTVWWYHSGSGGGVPPSL